MAKEFTLEGEIGWEIDTYDVKNILSQAKGEDILINFASPGGSVFTGIKIFNLFRKYEGSVSFHLIGEAASMGSYIVLSGEGLPTAEPNATFMIHNARGFVGGDHNAMRKRADIVEGLSNIMLAEYVKATGLEETAIKQMMDDETFFFGEAIKTAGFASEIKGTADTSDQARQSVIALAKESFEACMAKVNTEKQDDYEQAAAMLTDFQASNIPRIKAEKPKEEKTSMNLEQFLAENPAEKDKYDAAIKTAVDTAKAEMKAIVAKVTPIIGSADYSKCLPTAIKVLSGESNVVALDSVVAMIDMEIEAAKQAEVVNGAAPETPPNGQPVAVISENGEINNEDDYQAAIKADRAAFGMEA